MISKPAIQIPVVHLAPPIVTVVRNRNVDGWGDWSEVTGTTDSVPGSPTGMTAVPGGATPAQRQTRITITWTPQPSQNNPITGFKWTDIVRH